VITHSVNGRDGRFYNTDQTNRYQYRLLADGTIIDKRDDNKPVGYITNQTDLEVLFKMHRGVQQKLLIQHLHEQESQT
jgi:hypothetical protein